MSSGQVSKTPFTTEIFAGLLFEYQWNAQTLTYSIPSGTAFFSQNYSTRNEWNNWYVITSSQAQRFRELIDEVNRYINLEIIEVPDDRSYGDIRIAYTDAVSSNSLGYAYLPTPRFVNGTQANPASGDIWLSTDLYNQNDTAGSHFYHILMHELGHALGLTHPFEANTPFPRTPTEFDNFQYSVMSYSQHPSHFGAYPKTFMPFDILALQYLYGANLDYSPEDTVYQFTDNIGIITIWDPNGFNTLDFSALSSSVTVDMNEGGFSSAGSVETAWERHQPGNNNLALAYGTQIHEVIGTDSNDTIIGNSLDNTVYLGSGNDLYIYKNGIDYVDGESGHNILALPGMHDEWLLSQDNNSAFTLSHQSNSSSIVHFTNISEINFDNRSFALNELLQKYDLIDEPTLTSARLTNPNSPFDSAIITDSNFVSMEEAQLYRIYLGLLDRVPDQAGFEWWLNRSQQDASFDQLIAGFYNSPPESVTSDSINVFKTLQ